MKISFFSDQPSAKISSWNPHQRPSGDIPRTESIDKVYVYSWYPHHPINQILVGTFPTVDKPVLSTTNKVHFLSIPPLQKVPESSSSPYWCIGASVHYCVFYSYHRWTGALVHWRVSASAHKCIVVYLRCVDDRSLHCSIGPSVHWCIGTLVRRFIRVFVHYCVPIFFL